MSGKTTLLLLTASVLLTSLLVVNLPQVNALVQRDFSILDDSHTTASYGYSKVCGNHLCAPGEHTKWLNAVWHSQSTSYGKVTNAPHGEDVMHQMAGSTAPPMSSHGTIKMSGNMTMTGNMTKSK
jgi:hypothetical protein